jgi:hypothetical protein
MFADNRFNILALVATLDDNNVGWLSPLAQQ